MPYNSKLRSKKASKQLRDKNGHFYSPKPKVKVSGPTNILADLVKTENGDDKGSSWITLSINHPFRKIIEILEQIKNKQSTKVDLSFTIPLVALPIVLILAFQVGRYQTECQTHFSTQIGTIQNITVIRKVAPDHWFLNALTHIPFIGDAYIEEKTLKESVLINPQNETILINNEANADLNPFNQAKVIIFGDYNACSHSLILDSAQNISNY